MKNSYGQNNIKMNIKKIVKESLEKKYQINESFRQIYLHENKSERFDLTIQYLGSLIDEGYGEDDLKTVINEQFGWIKDIFGNIGNVVSGGWSQFKEFLISEFLKLIGFKGPLANAIATAMNEMNLSDIISVFRGRQGCLKHGPTVADAVSEALVRYILEELTEQNSMAFNFIRNTVFEYIKSSQFGETLSKTLCNAAYSTGSNVERKIGNLGKRGGQQINNLSTNL